MVEGEWGETVQIEAGVGLVDLLTARFFGYGDDGMPGAAGCRSQSENGGRSGCFGART